MPDRKQYHHSYIAELKSVTRLEDMLAQTEEVIPHISRGDREPGEDGSIIVLAEEEPVSCGRLIVQVKKLSEDLLDPPRERIDLAGLYHYLAEDTPFLLIGVNLEDDVAYWQHIDGMYIQEEVDTSQDSTTVRFDSGQTITYDTRDYVDAFRAILQETREIYDAERVDEIRNAVADLQEIGHRKRAFRTLELELDDATRSLLRTRGIAYGPFDKLRGLLRLHGITDTRQDRIYRSITSTKQDNIEDFSNTEFDRLVDNGLELLEYLCEEQHQ